MSDHQQIFVLAEKHSTERSCSVQQPVIVERRRAIFIRRQNIDVALPQSGRNGPGHMMIHVEEQHQLTKPTDLSFDLSERQMGMLTLDFIRVPVMGHTIQRDFKDLGLRTCQPKFAIGTLFDVRISR